MGEPESASEAGRAWRDLLDGIRDLDLRFLEGDNAAPDEQTEVEGYQFLATLLGVALDVFVFADPARPQFVDVNMPERPDRCWGGDNTDASYQFCAVDPALTYRVSGRRGDSAYFSVTVYNEPAAGRWSDRIVGIVNDTDLDAAAGEEFEFFIGPQRPHAWQGPFIELADDAAHVLTRDYQTRFDSETRTRFRIEAIDPPAAPRRSDVRLAAGLRAARTWIDQQFLIVPMPLGGRSDNEFSQGHTGPSGVNVIADPYQVPDANFGWSARDACYAFGSFDLRSGEALVITHRPPSCRFWNVNLWNPFMAKFDHNYARVSVNGGTAVPNADGTVTTVISRATGLQHPNAISTLDHRQGMIAFRWFLADEVPERPTSSLVPLAEAPTSAN